MAETVLTDESLVRVGDYSLKWIAAAKRAQWHSRDILRLGDLS
jgi:hypothetical protein